MHGPAAAVETTSATAPALAPAPAAAAFRALLSGRTSLKIPVFEGTFRRFTRKDTSGPCDFAKVILKKGFKGNWRIVYTSKTGKGGNGRQQKHYYQ